MAKDESRIAFEEWAAEHCLMTAPTPDGDYLFRGTNVAWRAWQKATRDGQDPAAAAEMALTTYRQAQDR